MANMTFSECQNKEENDMETTEKTKFCKHCGATIPEDAVICTACGRQVEQVAQTAQPQIVVNNANTNSNVNTNTNVAAGYGRRMCNKWVSLVLCLTLGCVGAHKFYEGKGGMGILYLLTFGLFFIGIIADAISILMKPNPYCV